MRDLYTILLLPIDLICFTLGLVLAVITLFLMRKHAESGRIEDVRFRNVCAGAALYSALGVLRTISILNTAELINSGFLTLTFYIMEVAYLVYTLMWVIFVDTALYHSSDGIKRRYRLAYVPLIILLVSLASAYLITMVSVGMMSNTLADPFLKGLLSILSRLSGTVAFVITFSLGAVYMVYAYMLVRSYQKDVKQPVFLRLDVFIIPWFLGFCFLLSVILPALLRLGSPRLPDISGLCAGLSVIFTYRSMMNRYIYMESETGFYKEDFLKLLPEFMEEKHLKVNCALVLTPSDEKQKISGIVSDLKPDRSTIISLNNSRLLLLSDVQNESAVKLFVQNIRSCVYEATGGVTIEDATLFRDLGETSTNFVQRALKTAKE